jgi:hypothetical protein
MVGVGGSNPLTPTIKNKDLDEFLGLFLCLMVSLDDILDDFFFTDRESSSSSIYLVLMCVVIATARQISELGDKHHDRHHRFWKRDHGGSGGTR